MTITTGSPDDDPIQSAPNDDGTETEPLDGARNGQHDLRASGSSNPPPGGQHDPPRDSGPTPSGGADGGEIAGHWVQNMIVRALGYDDTPIPPQYVTCQWLLDHAPSDGLRGVEADPPLSACGRHFVELE